MKTKDLNFLFERGIIFKQEFAAAANGESVEMDNTAIFKKLKKGILHPLLLLSLKSTVASSKKAKKLAKRIPETFDTGKFENWRKKIEAFRKA